MGLALVATLGRSGQDFHADASGDAERKLELCWIQTKPTLEILCSGNSILSCDDQVRDFGLISKGFPKASLHAWAKFEIDFPLQVRSATMGRLKFWQPEQKRHAPHAGPGYGGSGFPKDTLALIKTGQDEGVSLRIVETVVSLNDACRRAIERKVIHVLGGSVRKIALLGLVFKPNADGPNLPQICLCRRPATVGGRLQSTVTRMSSFFQVMFWRARNGGGRAIQNNKVI